MAEQVDKLTLVVAALRRNPAMTEQQIADLLGLKRAASALFWKLLAQKQLEQGPFSEKR